MRRVFGISAFVLLFVVCAPAMPSPAAPGAADAGAALPAAEVQAFCAELSEILARKDLKAYHSLFDRKRMIDDIFDFLRPLDLPENMIHRLRQRLDDDIVYALGLNVFDGGADWRFIGVRGTAQRPHAMFRVQTSDPKSPRLLDYRALAIGRGGDGKLRIVDLINCSRSVSVVQYLQRNTLCGLAEQLKRMDLVPAEYVRVKQVTDHMRQLAETGDAALALGVFESLEEPLKSLKDVLSCRIEIAARLGDAEYRRAVEDMAARMPTDLYVNLHVLPLAYSDSSFDRVLAVLEAIERAVGSDPYLDSERGVIAATRKEFDKAYEHFTRAAERESDLYEPHEYLLELAIARREHAETLRYLRVMRDRFGTDYGDLTKEPRFAEFVRSPQYRQWLTLAPPPAEPATRPSWKF